VEGSRHFNTLYLNDRFSRAALGSVDKIRLQRVVDVMRQFLGFGKFDIGSMLMDSASSAGG
jgi:hypothetical protein